MTASNHLHKGSALAILPIAQVVAVGPGVDARLRERISRPSPIFRDCGREEAYVDKIFRPLKGMAVVAVLGVFVAGTADYAYAQGAAAQPQKKVKDQAEYDL